MSLVHDLLTVSQSNQVSKATRQSAWAMLVEIAARPADNKETIQARKAIAALKYKKQKKNLGDATLADVWAT